MSCILPKLLNVELKTKGLYCLPQTKDSTMDTVGGHILVGWMDGQIDGSMDLRPSL